jgi:hypothetical protein
MTASTAHCQAAPVESSDLTVVIPFRQDTPHRIENLATVLRALGSHLGGVDILVIEDGPDIGDSLSEAKQSGTLPKGLRHVRRVQAGGFHRTRLLNHGMINLTDRPIVASWDCDVLAYPQAISDALTRLRAGAPAVFPHDGRFIDLRGAQRSRLIEGGYPVALPAAPWPERLALWPSWPWPKAGMVCLNTASVGGALMVRREAFAGAGGYHEGFRAWGFEDAELVTRLTTLGLRPEHGGGWPLLHLSHPRQRSKGWYEGRRVNQALCARMGKLGRDEILAAIAAGGLRGPDDGPPLPTWPAPGTQNT